MNIWVISYWKTQNLIDRNKLAVISYFSFLLFFNLDMSALFVIGNLLFNLTNFFCRYYAWDYRVLKMFARHYSTGEVIPEKLVDSMNRARNMFSALELQRQVFLANVFFL